VTFRGRSHANAMFGNAASVLVGDFLYSRAFQMMVSVNRMRVLEVLADATNVIAEGEVLQLMNMHDPDITVDDYLRVIRFKTAKLFEASARLGAVLAGGRQRGRRPAPAYGRALGTAFQLVDDLLDYEGKTDELGKNVGDDLREGKPTLPLLAGHAAGRQPSRQLIRTPSSTAKRRRTCPRSWPSCAHRRAGCHARGGRPRPTRRRTAFRACLTRPGRLC
jgi:octaprenyl-diphosphate synthase